MLLVANVFGALEHHVFEEVGKSGAANFLAVGTHVVCNVHVHQWIGMVLVQDHREAVIQPVLRVGNRDATVVAGEFLDQGEAFRQVWSSHPLGLGVDWLRRFLASRQQEQRGHDEELFHKGFPR